MEFSDLPDEVVLHILSFVSVADLLRFEGVNQHFRELISQFPFNDERDLLLVLVKRARCLHLRSVCNEYLQETRSGKANCYRFIRAFWPACVIFGCGLLFGIAHIFIGFGWSLLVIAGAPFGVILLITVCILMKKLISFHSNPKTQRTRILSKTFTIKLAHLRTTLNELLPKYETIYQEWTNGQLEPFRRALCKLPRSKENVSLLISVSEYLQPQN
jgi:hypothetical protein